MSSSLSLPPKVAIITGSTSGIGRGSAIEFARHGYRLVVTGRDQAAAGETERECRNAGAPEVRERRLVQNAKQKKTRRRAAFKLKVSGYLHNWRCDRIENR